LHGNETPEFCKNIESHCEVIKAFQINETFNFNEIEKYMSTINYILFDTKTNNYGGSGITFNWELLKKYENTIPFF